MKHVVGVADMKVARGSDEMIVTVQDAVLRLGAARILELAVGRRVAAAMSRSCDGYELAEHELWRHSVAAALAAERLGRFTSQKVPGVAFTAALIHDVGKLILGRQLDAQTVVQFIHKPFTPERVREVVQNLIGVTHDAGF